MRFLRTTSRLLLFVLVGSGVVAQSVPGEKVWEGRYVRLKDGVEVSDSGQSWVLWRQPEGGYIIESRFNNVNLAAALMVGMVISGGANRVDPKLRSEIVREIAQRELVINLDSNLAMRTVALGGDRLVDRKYAVVAKCDRTEKGIRCKGIYADKKLKAKEPTALVFSYGFPLLLTALVVQAEGSPGKAISFKAGFVEIVNHAPTLRQTDARFQFEQEEAITIGERGFTAGKYRLVVEHKSERLLDVVIWSGKNGLVLVMEDQQHFPGERTALVEFKRHAPFP